MRPPSNSWNSSRQILGIARASYEVSDLNREMELLPELCSLITRHAGRGRIATARTSIPGLKVVASSVTTEPINHVYEPLFGLVVPGAKRILLGDRMLDYGAGQYTWSYRSIFRSRATLMCPAPRNLSYRLA